MIYSKKKIEDVLASMRRLDGGTRRIKTLTEAHVLLLSGEIEADVDETFLIAELDYHRPATEEENRIIARAKTLYLE